MATCTLLTARLKRAIGTAGFASSYADADLMSQLNSSMLTIARRVKLSKLTASALVYTNAQTTVHTGTGAATDMAVDWNPTAGADAKVIIVTVQAGGATFKYSINGGTDSAAVTITGKSQTIYKKIAVTFAATTATAADTWTFTAYADLPSDFQYGMIRAERTITTGILKVWASYQELRERHQSMNDSGSPDECAIGEQKQLFVQGCPSASESIRIFYQKKPTAFTAGSDDLDAIGDEYQYTALIYHAAKEILEDAGQAELAARMENRYEREMMNLAVEEGVTDDIAEEVRDENMYTDGY